MYLKIGEDIYKAEFTGKMKDVDWDNRSSKTITLANLPLNIVKSILHDNAKWHIYIPHTTKQQKIDPETGEPMVDENGDPIMEEIDTSEDYDNSEFSVRGDIIEHPDGTISVKMGKPTDLEQAYELLYGGN